MHAAEPVVQNERLFGANTRVADHRQLLSDWLKPEK